MPINKSLRNLRRRGRVLIGAGLITIASLLSFPIKDALKRQQELAIWEVVEKDIERDVEKQNVRNYYHRWSEPSRNKMEVLGKKTEHMKRQFVNLFIGDTSKLSQDNEKILYNTINVFLSENNQLARYTDIRNSRMSPHSSLPHKTEILYDLQQRNRLTMKKLQINQQPYAYLEPYTQSITNTLQYDNEEFEKIIYQATGIKQGDHLSEIPTGFIQHGIWHGVLAPDIEYRGTINYKGKEYFTIVLFDPDNGYRIGGRTLVAYEYSQITVIKDAYQKIIDEKKEKKY